MRLAIVAYLALFGGAPAGAVDAPFQPVVLPDGTLFESWEQPLTFTKTYHVAQKHRKASDENPGTADLPWQTISKAAQVLQPGEQVIVHEGVYREWVKPARGGSGPQTMISYEAAPGEDVVVKGSDVWQPKWEMTELASSQGPIAVWRAALTPEMFEGPNTFALPNFPEQEDKNAWRMFPTFELLRGQILVNGQPLVQTPRYEQLADESGRFWVGDDRLTLFVRLYKDARPHRKTVEVTTREQVFAPIEPYLNYIRVKGFRMFHAANGVPIPPPQRGLLSATRGHHWIIEDCEIGHANAIGMDLGGQWWGYGKGEMQGYHIVRRNYVHHCGVSSISAWHNMANERLLIEDNLITDNSWMPIMQHYESSGIKIHRTEHCVFRRNVVMRTGSGSSIWLDGEIFNTRITQNLCYDANAHSLGSVFLEINQGPNLVDNNIVIGSADQGFHQHDADRVVLLQNLFADAQGYGVHLVRGDPKRSGPKPPFENHHRVFGNIFAGCGKWILRANETTHSDYNVFDGGDKAAARMFTTHAADGKPEELNLEAWRGLGEDAHSVVMDVKTSFDPKRLVLRTQCDALPAFDVFPELLPETAPAAALLTHDYFGQPRPKDEFAVGPFGKMPLDGSPVHVDRRCSAAQKRFPVPAAPKMDLAKAYTDLYRRPREFSEDYEDQVLGQQPGFAETYGCKNGADIAVTDETASSGRHSLKFTDVGAPNSPWEPEMCYRAFLSEGIAKCSFDVRLEEGAVAYNIWRSPNDEGPYIIFNNADEVVVEGKVVAHVPRGQWFHVDIECALGKQATGVFTLTITSPQEKTQRIENLPCKFQSFRELEACFFLSFAERPAVMYLDNVHIAAQR